MGNPVRWSWRIALAAIWLVLTGWWILLPPLDARCKTLDLPFLEISLFQTPSAVVISPTTDEAIPLRVLDDAIASLDLEAADLEQKLAQPLPPEFRNRGLLKILFGPPSPRRLWRYQLGEAKRQRRDAVEARHALQTGHVNSLGQLNTEVEALLAKARGRASICGPLFSFVQPTAPLLPGPVYVATKPLWIVAALGLIPLAAAPFQAVFGVGRRRKARGVEPEIRPPVSATEADLATAARGRRIRQPRWFRRLAVGLGVTLAGFLIAHWSTTDRRLQIQLRASDDLRIRVEHGCFLLGNFFDADWRERNAQQAWQTPSGNWQANAITRLGFFFQERFWTYEPANAIRLVSQRALTRGASFLQDGFQTVLALGGWVAGIPGLLFLIPIFSGLISEARMAARRRRGLCAACAYPLIGLPEPRCPECGLVQSGKSKRKAERGSSRTEPAATQDSP